jgi:hypothetical protein
MQRFNETKVVENCSVQFVAATVAQQSFHVTVCVPSRFKTTAFYDETIVSRFMKPISCTWFPPPSV